MINRPTSSSRKTYVKLKTLSIIFWLLLGIGYCSVSAQVKSGNTALSIGINIPVGNFSNTHLIGIDADYSPARHRFGLFKLNHIAFTYSGGGSFYFGKKETVSGYPYKYPGYIFIYGLAGLLYNPARNFSFILYAGPGLGIYHGHKRFTIGSKLEMNYDIGEKFSMGPGIFMMKEPAANPLWSATLKTTMRF